MAALATSSNSVAPRGWHGRLQTLESEIALPIPAHRPSPQRWPSRAAAHCRRHQGEKPRAASQHTRDCVCASACHSHTSFTHVRPRACVRVESRAGAHDAKGEMVVPAMFALTVASMSLVQGSPLQPMKCVTRVRGIIMDGGSRSIVRSWSATCRLENRAKHPRRASS